MPCNRHTHGMMSQSRRATPAEKAPARTPAKTPVKPPGDSAGRDLLGRKVSDLIETHPGTLPVLIEAGFTPLSFAPLRAVLAPTVTLDEALRIRSLDDAARRQLLAALREAL